MQSSPSSSTSEFLSQLLGMLQPQPHTTVQPLVQPQQQVPASNSGTGTFLLLQTLRMINQLLQTTLSRPRAALGGEVPMPSISSISPAPGAVNIPRMQPQTGQAAGYYSLPELPRTSTFTNPASSISVQQNRSVRSTIPQEILGRVNQMPQSISVSFEADLSKRSENDREPEYKQRKENENKHANSYEMHPLQCDPMCVETDNNTKICLLYLGENQQFQFIVLSKFYGSVGWIYNSAEYEPADHNYISLQGILPLFLREFGYTDRKTDWTIVEETGNLEYRLTMREWGVGTSLIRLEPAMALGFRSIYTENYSHMMRRAMDANLRDEKAVEEDYLSQNESEDCMQENETNPMAVAGLAAAIAPTVSAESVGVETKQNQVPVD
jgi:hypothetical protein